MKILVCGEYSIFCNDLITRLKKEKHDVFVITGSQGRKSEKPKTGVFQDYEFSYRSKNISTVMKNIQADLMIVLGVCDTKYTWHDANQESVRYLTAMTNLLMSAKDAGIPQVIYCSSLGVYEDFTGKLIDKDTDFEASSVMMRTLIQTERTCQEQNKPGEFQIAVIRYPEVYGDSKTLGDNTCTRILESFWDSKGVSIQAGKEHRVLYVKDAVDVLMRVLNREEKDESYLVSGTTYTERQIYDTVHRVMKGRETDVVELEYDMVELPDIVEPKREELGFYEKYSLEEGLKEFYSFFEKEKDLESREDKEKSVVKERLIPLAENLGLFLLVTGLYVLLRDTWIATILDFYLLYTVGVAVVYGCGHSLLAVLLVFLARIGEILLLGEAFEYTTFTEILPILIVGVLVGYMRDKYKRSYSDMEDAKNYYQSELVDLTRIYDGNRYVKEIYEKRLVAYDNSMARIYEVTRKLDFWEPQKVVFRAIDVVQELMDIEDVSIYIADENSSYMRLAASSNPSVAGRLGKSIRVDENFFMLRELKERDVYRNRDIDTAFPTYACGLYQDERISGVIMLWTRELSKINLHETNTIALICRMIESSVNHAVTYWNMHASQYIEGTNVLQEEDFDKIQKIYEEGIAENKLECTFLRVLCGQEQRGSDVSVYEKVGRYIRQTDIVGEKAGDICIILTNTGLDEAAHVLERLQNAGIQVENFRG